MKKTQKRIRLMVLLTLVVAMLFTTVVIAGSPGATFSFTFGNGTPNAQRGTKTDAGDPSGNYASVRVNGYNGIDYAYLWVTTSGGSVCTGDKYVGSTGLYEIPYTVAVTNGTLYLRASSPSVGGGGMSGTWYP